MNASKHLQNLALILTLNKKKQKNNPHLIARQY